MDFKNVRELMKRLTETGPAGNAITVTVEGKKVFEHYEGMADVEAGRPTGPDTVFRMFSDSKVMTAVAALILYERGVYLLDDPVAAYLPEFSELKVAAYEDNGIIETLRPAKNVLKVRDCFCHTTGLTYAGKLNMTQQKLLEVQGGLMAGGPYTLEQLMKAIAKEVPLLYEPGTRFHYGLSVDLLGRLVEVWSGKTLGQFIKDEITGPLGMEETSFSFKGDQKDRLCAIYNRENGELKRYQSRADAFYDPRFICDMGGQGLISTAGDYAKLMSMLANGGTLDGVRILGKNTIDLMRQNHLTWEQTQGLHNTLYRWPQLKGHGFGLGVSMIIDPAAAGVYAPCAFGWSGMAGTKTLADPANKLAIVYAHQCLPNDKNLDWYTHPRIVNAVYAAL
ncbi:MAG: beta-lactamase family protein [Clostridia bacterium]|nr:beta-lactamase family protein [Clostridia bacterium]